MATTLPFSITPDAADFIRNRLDMLPPVGEPALIVTTSQSGDEKHPRWSYEGESFIIGVFEDPAERPPSDYFDLFGHRVAVAHDALKRLAGLTLALRRVDARYGLFKDTMHVLVAASESDTIPATPEDQIFAKKWTRFFRLGLLSVMSAFCGVGIAWVAFGIFAVILFNKRFDEFVGRSIPILIAGGILGLIAGFFFFRFVFKTKGRTLFQQEQVEEKYFVYGSWASMGSWLIFLDIPVSLVVLSSPAYDPLGRTVGQDTAVYVALVIALAIFATCLIVCDRIPHRLVVRLGLVGWAITLMLASWHFGLAPKLLGHRKA
jgi:hypothetical protein